MTALVGGSRRVGSPRVKYVKKAKMLDLRKLKEDIRKSLDIGVPDPETRMMNPWYGSQILPFSIFRPPQCDTVDYILRLVSNL